MKNRSSYLFPKILFFCICVSVYILGCDNHNRHKAGDQLSTVTGVSAIKIEDPVQHKLSSSVYKNPATAKAYLGTVLMMLAPTEFEVPYEEALSVRKRLNTRCDVVVEGKTRTIRFMRFAEFLKQDMGIELLLHAEEQDGYEIHIDDIEKFSYHLDNPTDYLDNTVDGSRYRFTDNGIYFNFYTMQDFANFLIEQMDQPIEDMTETDGAYSFEMLDMGGYTPIENLELSLSHIGLRLKPARLVRNVVRVKGSEGIAKSDQPALELHMYDHHGQPNGFGGGSATFGKNALE